MDCDTWNGCRIDLVAVWKRAQMCFSAQKISCGYLLLHMKLRLFKNYIRNNMFSLFPGGSLKGVEHNLLLIQAVQAGEGSEVNHVLCPSGMGD